MTTSDNRKRLEAMKPMLESTKEDVDRMHLRSLKESADKLNRPITEVIIRDFGIGLEYSTPDGKTVITRPYIIYPLT